MLLQNRVQQSWEECSSRAFSRSYPALPEIENNQGYHLDQERIKTDPHLNPDDLMSFPSYESHPDDHIYETIDSDIDSSDSKMDDSNKEDLLLSLSFERRRNLKFYGSTSWDFNGT